MLKLSKDDIKKLNPSKKELRVIARERGVKNYKNLSKSELIREMNKLKPAKGPKTVIFEKYKGDDLELKRKDIKKIFRLKKEKKILMGKKKDVLKRLDLKKITNKILEIKKIVKSLLLNKKEKIKQN